MEPRKGMWTLILLLVAVGLLFGALALFNSGGLRGGGTVLLPQSVDNSPESAVRKMLAAIEAQDPNHYLDVLDPALRQEPNYFFASALVKGVQSTLGLKDIGNLNQVAFRDLQLQTTANDGATAKVHVLGKMRNVALATESDFSGDFFVRQIAGVWYVSDPKTLLPPKPNKPVLHFVILDSTTQADTDGWAKWSAHLALENVGGAIYRGKWPSGKGQVTVKEGFSYPADFGYESKVMFTGDWTLVLPPGFRARGFGGFATLVVSARIAEKTTPQRLTFADLSATTIETPTKKVSFPADAQALQFSTVPDTIEIPKIAHLIVEGFDLNTDNTLLVNLKFTNLNLGQEESLRDNQVTVATIDQNGNEATWLSRILVPGGGCQPPYDRVFMAGPGQTQARTLCLYPEQDDPAAAKVQRSIIVAVRDDGGLDTVHVYTSPK